MPGQLVSLLGSLPSSDVLSTHLNDISSEVSLANATAPEIKSYPDAVYFNYFALGLSFLFAPQNGYKPKTCLKRSELQEANLVLDSIDIYNIPKPEPSAPGAAPKATSSRTAELAFSTYPATPITLAISAQTVDKDGKEISRPDQLVIQRDTSGKDFVECLGEPDRKGGGAGPASGSIGIWCEWSKDGIMVEFGGDEARGPQAWERGKDAVWKVLTVFRPKND